MGPPRKIGKIWVIFGFFRPTQKMAREGPKWGGDAFLRHKKTSPTIWAEQILILRTFDFRICWGPKFASNCFMGENYFQDLASNFFMGEKYVQEFASIFFMGETYFQEFAPNFFMGGPHVGPPTWAPRGPTHFGPDAAGAAGRILRSQPDPSPNAPRDEIRRKDPCCDLDNK